MGSAEEPRRTFVFSFGLERLGLVALRAPYVVAAARRGDHRAGGHRRLQAAGRRLAVGAFPHQHRGVPPLRGDRPALSLLSEYDVLVVVEGPDLLKRKQLDDLHRADDGAATHRRRLRAWCRWSRRAGRPMRRATRRPSCPTSCPKGPPTTRSSPRSGPTTSSRASSCPTTASSRSSSSRSTARSCASAPPGWSSARSTRPSTICSPAPALPPSSPARR